jgi:hypothetical protein
VPALKKFVREKVGQKEQQEGYRDVLYENQQRCSVLSGHTLRARGEWLKIAPTLVSGAVNSTQQVSELTARDTSKWLR